MLFTNINLIPMTDEKIVSNQTVLVEGARIVDLGPSDEVRTPENETIIDGKGAYLMPGLADMHMHTREEWLSDFWPVSPFHLYLANGVTTIRDFGPIGDAPIYVLQWRDEITDGSRIGPSIYSSGTPLIGPIEDTEKIIREQNAQGFDFIKLYSFLSIEEFHGAMTTAKQLGMYTAGHIPFAVGLEGVLAEGMDEIAHIEELDFEFINFDRNKNLEAEAWFAYIMGEAIQHGVNATIPIVVDKLKAVQVPVCTTMVVGDIIVQKLLKPESFLARPENRYLPPRYFQVFRKGEEKHQRQFSSNENLAVFKHEMEKTLLTELHRAEITLLLSTDAGTGEMGLVPGLSIHDELRILTENGFTPYEAIASGTANAARVVKKMTGKGDFGTIEAGKQADLLLVKENPLDDVANIKCLLGVMASGRWYPEETLEQMIASED